jgi:HSP20 family protein
MSTLRNSLGRAWDQVQAGWSHLVQKASDALTRFTSSDDGADPDTRTLLRLSPDWGLLAAEVRETDKDVRVRLELPGMQAGDIDVQVHGKLLKVSGEKQVQRQSDEGRYHVTECAYGSFERQIPLPAEVDTGATQADYQSGVLTLRLPKATTARVRRIPISRA